MTKNAKSKFHVEVLLDATGSMQRDWAETVGAVNGYISNLLANKELDVVIKVRLFSKIEGKDTIRKILKVKSGSHFTKLNSEDEQMHPEGMTPLNQSIAVVGEKLLAKYNSGDRVEMCIITDGLENCSASGYTKARAMLAIDAMKKNEWLIKFLAATVESFKTAISLGINPGASAQYKGANVGATLDAVTRSSFAYGVTGQSVCGDFTEQELRSMVDDKKS
jgi:hypothetical protein